MKIFMLVSRVPWPLEKGDKLRAYHQLKHLAAGHEVFLCCLSDKKVDEKALDHLRTITPHVHVIPLNRFLIGWRLFTALFSDKPFQVNYFFQQKAARKVKELVRTFSPEAIYCQLIRTSEYVKHMHDHRKTLDYMDALSAGQKRRIGISPWWMRAFVREEARRLMAYENLVFDYFEHHTIISAQDRQLIVHPERNRIVVVPNGVDAAFFKPKQSEKKFDILFTGNMSYPPNVDCALRLVNEILPLVHKKNPDVNLLIAGATPSASVQHLAGTHVEVSGWMEDIREAYDSSRIFLAPMRTGSGLQNKLLEAMCMQLACITSPLAANAMNVEHGREMLIGDSNEEFADMVITLLTDRKRADELAIKGHEYVTRNFSWRGTVDTLEDVLGK